MVYSEEEVNNVEDEHDQYVSGQTHCPLPPPPGNTFLSTITVKLGLYTERKVISRVCLLASLSAERPSYFYRPQTKLQEGNVFTPVYDSVHREGVSQDGMGRRGVCVGGGCRPPPRRPLKRTVRILLECILVSGNVCLHQH